HMERAFRQTELQFEGAFKCLTAVEGKRAGTETLRARVEYRILVVVNDLNHDAHVVMTSPGTSFDCDVQLVARIELDACAASIVCCDLSDHNATLLVTCTVRALLLPARVIGLDDLCSWPNHLHLAPLQQQAALTQVCNCAQIVGYEDNSGAAHNY